MKPVLLKLILTVQIIAAVSSASACVPDNTTNNPTTSITQTIPITMLLPQAKPYTVSGELNLANEDKTRTAGLWAITANEAAGFEEYAQTAVQAVIDLRNFYKRDYTSVILYPDTGMDYSGVKYASASYAADGLGAAGMTGSAPAKEMYWKVWSTNEPKLTAQEIAVTRLWTAKMMDFPPTDMLSSKFYDEKALRQYISDTLGIPYADTLVRQLAMTEYVIDESAVKFEGIN